MIVSRSPTHVQWAKYQSSNAVMVFDSIAVFQNLATTIEAVTSRTTAQFERKTCPGTQFTLTSYVKKMYFCKLKRTRRKASEHCHS